MIKTVTDGNILASRANFIVNLATCQSDKRTKFTNQITSLFSHVEKEYMTYLKHCNKNHINPLGTVQYIPVDVWALIMVDTLKNKNIIEYDSNYQYIVNLFGISNSGNGFQVNMDIVKAAFVDILDKAKSINATIAIPYRCGSEYGVNWSNMYALIEQVFSTSTVNVEIWQRCD